MAVALEPEVLTLRARIRNEIDFDPTAANEVIAERILREVDKYDLAGLLEAEVAAVRREDVRRHERQGILKLTARFGTAKKPVTRTSTADRLKVLNDLRALRSKSIDLGNGRVVPWGQATVEELRERRAMLVKQRNGIDTTVRQIDEVIAVLEREGAPCLDQLAA